MTLIHECKFNIGEWKWYVLHSLYVARADLREATAPSQTYVAGLLPLIYIFLRG